MKQSVNDIIDWLRLEEHILAGPSFQYEGFTCFPVVPATEVEGGMPSGFLVQQENALTYIRPVPSSPVDNLRWESMLMTYLICKSSTSESIAGLPSEYWYG